MDVRVFFEKKGAGIYFSHLDLQRAVARALSRSNLDFAYTEGFNPHLRMVFSPPLSMFQQSKCEMLDLRTVTDHPYEELEEQLRAAFPDCLKITEVAAPERKLGEIAFASYEVKLPESALPEKVLAALEGPVVVMKKSKKGQAETDIAPLIASHSAEKTSDGVLLKVKASASPDAYLNPQYLCAYLGYPEAPVTRTAFFTADGHVMR